MRAKLLFRSLIILSMVPFSSLNAQQIEGVYRLSGGHEMVAAFQFKKDSSFEFYFIYGAVDRSAKGRFTVREGRIFLHADKIPGKDFTIILQEKRGPGTTIKISNPNPALVHNVVGIFKKGTEEDQQYSDTKGNIHSAINTCDSIFVIHTLFPDEPTLIKKDEANRNNYFELSLNPSLAELSFKDFTLVINEEGLSGSLPWLFEREKAIFIKEPGEVSK